MTAEEFLETHLHVIEEALSLYRSRMEDNHAEVVSASEVPGAPIVFKDMAKTFEKQADSADEASRDLISITRFNEDGKRELRPRAKG